MTDAKISPQTVIFSLHATNTIILLFTAIYSIKSTLKSTDNQP